MPECPLSVKPPCAVSYQEIQMSKCRVIQAKTLLKESREAFHVERPEKSRIEDSRLLFLPKGWQGLSWEPEGQ